MKKIFLILKCQGRCHYRITVSKRVDLFILLLLLTFTIDAQTINSESAKQIAESFLGKEVRESNESRHRKMARVEASIPNTPAIYFFNATDGKGFVIVSGDEGATTPVLAYSKNGVFDIDNVPEAALLLISQYTKSIETLSKSNSKEHGVSKTKALPSTEGSANPLLSTQWDQGSPYNDECPVLNGSHALTGCVATAMAQVINYEMKSNRVKSINGYDTEDGYHVEDLPARDFDFGNLDNDGIAHLMRYCGQSVRMNYGLEKSGAHSEYIPEALHEYFGWESQIGVLKRENYNEEHWNRIISEEITAGHPLIYSAHTEAGDGHAFVVDGYADGFYHVNWGWGGLSDGYYSFSLFSSENRSDYILMQEIVTTRDDDPSNDVITYGTTINGINYQLQDDFTAIVLPLKDGEKYRGEIVIPSSVEYEGKTYTVNYLGQNVFVNCKHLTSISIPASIIGQEWSIFDGCENLHKVNVEDLSSFIKLEVGGWWTGSPFTYGADLYLNGEIVKDLVIPEGIESVGYCKFANCTSIESVTMPSTMKVAGTYSFSNCPNLKTIDMLGSSLELIDELAFVNDAALQEIRLPVTLKTIRREAFGGENGSGCRSLRKVVCMAPTPPFRDGDGNAFSMRVLSDVDLYVPDDAVQLYQNAKEWRQFVEIAPLSQEKPLPQTDTVTVDGLSYEINITERYAKILGTTEGFDGNAIIPASINYNNETFPVEVIGYEAFYGQTLYDVDIPSRVRRVGIRSFMWAKVDSEIKLPDSLKYIPEKAFWDLKVPKLILGKYVEYIGENAFSSEDFIYDWSTETPIPEIECRSLVPPVIEENSFDSHQFANSVLTIPYGSKKAYAKADGWSNFNSIFNIGSVQEETLAHDLSLSASIQGRSSLQEGMPLKIKGTITNRGEQSVNGFNIIWDVDGVSVGSIAVDSILQPKELYDFNISIPFNDIKAGSHILGLATSLNNDVMDDDINDNLKSLSFSTFDDGYYRVSLIEQFTSEKCGFTPSANPKVFNAIENTDNSDFVAHVFNHCGYYDDFLTLNRDYEWFYNEGYGTYTPAVMLNRTDVAGKGYTPVMNVSEDFERNLINENGICDAMVSVFLEMNDDNACAKIVLTKTPNFDITEGYDYITVFLIEDSILARQQRDVWSDGYLENYYHRHVLRKVLSSTWGEPIQWKTNKSFCMFDTELNQEWKKENLSAVAFIHRYNPLSQTNCQVYTAGASNLPQYIELPDNFSDLAVKMYTLTYMVDGETYKTYEVEYGASITPEDDPTKEGYTFSGWSEIPETMPAKDVTVTGGFTINKYNLTYMIDDVTYKISEVEYGAVIKPETEPIKEGYTFSGWSEIPTKMPAKDVMVTGEFAVNQYTFTYMIDDQTYKTLKVKYGTKIIAEVEPTKEGYTFSGWSEIPETMPAKDVTVTGRFTINKYKLVYRVDDETYKFYEVEYGAVVTPEEDPTKEGYTFSGWSEIPATMPAKDITITGSFTKGEYQLTYVVDGQTYKTIRMDYDDVVTPEAAPEKEGYTFSGWSEIPETMPAKDVIVTGAFAINEYTLTYMMDGEPYKTYKVEYGASITPEADPEKEGYTFSGWSEIPETMPAKDVTVTGTFIPNKYTLTYVVSGEIYKMHEIEYDASIIPEDAPEKEGYTFSGWSEIPATMPAKDVTVTGTFSINTYTLAYMVDGETYKTFEVNYGESITPEVDPEKDGYTFSGWSDIPTVMPAKDVTVTGMFAINKYILTYQVDGETYKTYEVEYGTDITAEEEPTKDGYIFSGWSDIPATMPSEDVTVIGLFTFIDAIVDVIADDENYQIYTLDGKPIETLQKGVNIIRYTDGKVTKVLVK